MNKDIVLLPLIPGASADDTPWAVLPPRVAHAIDWCAVQDEQALRRMANDFRWQQAQQAVLLDDVWRRCREAGRGLVLDLARQRPKVRATGCWGHVLAAVAHDLTSPGERQMLSGPFLANARRLPQAAS